MNFKHDNYFWAGDILPPRLKNIFEDKSYYLRDKGYSCYLYDNMIFLMEDFFKDEEVIDILTKSCDKFKFIFKNDDEQPIYDEITTIEFEYETNPFSVNMIVSTKYEEEFFSKK